MEWSLQTLARKPNYDFEKRRKEMDRKAKKDAKREDRAQRRRAGLENEDAGPSDQGDGTAAQTPADGSEDPPGQ